MKVLVSVTSVAAYAILVGLVWALVVDAGHAPSWTSWVFGGAMGIPAGIWLAQRHP